MIPLKDYNPSRSFPFVTLLLIVMNVAVFVLDRLSGGYQEHLVRTPQGTVAVDRFVGGLSHYGAFVPLDMAAHFFTAWPTVFTSMFLHGNWLHIGSNMLYLWIFGDNLEDRLGRLRFLLFYLGSGVVAALTQFFTDPSSAIPMVGASGAVAGVMGGYLLLYPRAVVLTLVPIFFFFWTVDIPAFLVIGYWALLQFLNAAYLKGGGLLKGGGVAYFAHIGGFLSGIVLVLLLLRRKARGR